MPSSVSSESRPSASSRPNNKLLASLPDNEFERLRPHLQTVQLRPKEVMHRRNEPVRNVFFPNGGVSSVTAVMQNGAMVEIATVGDEGLVGLNAFLGGDMVGAETMLQVPDVPDTTAEVIAVEAFNLELDRRGPFFDRVHLYLQGLVTLMMHSTACIAFHPVQERCCRWLLMTHDRVRRDEFSLSHEFLAMMLGATRPTVTVVAGTLQKAGLIHYKHGRMTILDRKKLESASCECYGTVKAQFDRLGL
jgi:CRP-like cAMP-binding protein